MSDPVVTVRLRKKKCLVCGERYHEWLDRCPPCLGREMDLDGLRYREQDLEEQLASTRAEIKAAEAWTPLAPPKPKRKP